MKIQRLIGIRHRVKATAKQEPRPTLVSIREGSVETVYELKTETDELDFLLGRFPVAWRDLAEGEDGSAFPAHHVKTRKKGEEIVTRIPDAYDGLRAGDVVLMILGGSGDRLAYALSKRGESLGAKVFRIPSFVLAEHRPSEAKEADHENLVALYLARPELFSEVTQRDRELIYVSEALIARREVQQARIACEQRLRARAIGSIFLSEEGHYPQGTVEDIFDALKANDATLQALKKEEARRDADLRDAVRKLPVWGEVFSPITGMGEVLAAGIIAPIGDIRRFANPAKLKAFCGVHVLPDGRFPRRRSGEVANWHPRARQALFLLGDQFVKRADSPWGKKLREVKAGLRAKYPTSVTIAEELSKPFGRIQAFFYGKSVFVSPCGYNLAEVEGLRNYLADCGVEATRLGRPATPEEFQALEALIPTSLKSGKTITKYSDGHIHKMAIWKTLGKFVKWLHREWKRVDGESLRAAA